MVRPIYNDDKWRNTEKSWMNQWTKWVKEKLFSKINNRNSRNLFKDKKIMLLTTTKSEVSPN